MHTPVSLARLLFLLPALASVLRADPTVSDTRLAQLRLGEDTWSRIVRIHNTGSTDRYPRSFHALVFEVAGILWFYTPQEGTQSFSLHVDNLAAEKADFGPLLRDIDPGLTRWKEVNGASVAVNHGRALPNGCFVDSIVTLRERLQSGELVERPRLLSYYIPTADGVTGHTVLVYERSDQLIVVDTVQPSRRIRRPLALGKDPLALARTLDGGRVARAREVKLDATAQAMIARREPLEVRTMVPERRVGLR